MSTSMLASASSSVVSSVPTSPGSSSTRSSSSSSSSSIADEAYEVRLRAFDLLNKMGPEGEDDVRNWPRQPKRLSSYQNNPNAIAAAKEAAYYIQREDEDNDDDYNGTNAAVWGPSAVVQGFVQCVSDACKLGASGIVSQNASIAKSGYQTIKSAIVAETQDRFSTTTTTVYQDDRPKGTFENVPVSGYHNNYHR